MIADLIQPLRRIGDVRGRSTRSELAHWLALAMVAAILSDMLSATMASRSLARLAMSVLILVPTVPLAIRRVHDVGWSGWWLVAAVPALAYNLWLQAGRSLDPDFDATAAAMLPYIVLPMAIGLLIGTIMLMCWPGQHGANRFGPDLRG